MSNPIVRRLTAAALFLVLASAPALAASGAAPARRSSAPRVPVTIRLSLLDQFLDWLGVPAAGHLPDARGRFEKGETGQTTLDNVLELLEPTEDRGGMIDPNG
jgi:hypothetical protein